MMRSSTEFGNCTAHITHYAGNHLIRLFNLNVDNLDVLKRLVILICLGLLYCYYYIIALCDLQPTNMT